MKGPQGKKEWENYTNQYPEDMELVLTKELELPFSGEKRAVIVARPILGQMETKV